MGRFPPFEPCFRRAHLSTLAGNFWTRAIDEARFPTRRVLHQTAPGTQVLTEENSPATPRGTLLLLHGLEGSSRSGYMISMTQTACENGFRVVRLNMRGCGGTQHLTDSLYNAGLTDDVRSLAAGLPRPLILVGYSLGGNVMLKLAGEWAAGGKNHADGVIAVSTPLDLAACVRKMSQKQNRIYEWRFVFSLRNSYRRRHLAAPDRFPAEGLNRIATVYDFDNLITARHFGFGTADRYYKIQSSLRFLPRIELPTLLVQAQDDPLVPFELFQRPEVQQNPHVELLAPKHGGHLGFIARQPPRFWLDRVLMQWIEDLGNKTSSPLVLLKR